MFSCEALTAGRKPPINPIKRENSRVETTITGVRWKPNASTVNEVKFVVEKETNSKKAARMINAPPRDE
jgi:hypothetical protein